MSRVITQQYLGWRACRPAVARRKPPYRDGSRAVAEHGAYTATDHRDATEPQPEEERNAQQGKINRVFFFPYGKPLRANHWRY